MAEYDVFLDELFDDAEPFMCELSDGKGYFTNYEFIRRVAQRHQRAYARLLNYAADNASDEPWTFNYANQAIGGKLSTVAQQLGYSKQSVQDSGYDISEVNIFNDPVPKAQIRVYVRTNDVMC